MVRDGSGRYGKVSGKVRDGSGRSGMVPDSSGRSWKFRRRSGMVLLGREWFQTVRVGLEMFG